MGILKWIARNIKKQRKELVAEVSIFVCLTEVGCAFQFNYRNVTKLVLNSLNLLLWRGQEGGRGGGDVMKSEMPKCILKFIQRVRLLRFLLGWGSDSTLVH